MTNKHGNTYRERAVSHYSSLFTLPSTKKSYALLILQCILTGASTSLLPSTSLYGFLYGLVIGTIIFLVTYLCNYISSHWLLRHDLVLDFRRISFLSLISNSILSVFIFLDFLISSIYGASVIELRATSIGVFASLALRILVFQSASFVVAWRIGIAIFLQPSLFLASLFIPQLPFLESFENILVRLSISTLAAFICIQILIRSLNIIGIQRVGIPTIKLFKAFFADWTEGIVEPLEEIFEYLSEEHDIKVSMIAFRSKKEMKALIVVPGLHPGPFKNVGSSQIPSIIQEALEKKFGCVVSVPHGISGHELDLASHSENMKILDRILKAEFTDFESYASPFLSLVKNSATANCQIFGKCALIILTLAPNTMEDLPLELRELIAQEAKKRGLSSALTVDAHNSISGYFDPERIKKPILDAVSSALDKISETYSSRFKVGAAKIVPSEFNIREGMGPGGITVMIVDVDGEKTAYITIDGNNMVSGLREKILSEIKRLGIDNGEVMTTDTHAVNAVVISDLGYHPVGEVISHEKLICYIKECVRKALDNLESAEASWCEEIISGVKVIGERQIDNLCLIVDEASKKIKRISIILFPSIILLLVLIMAIL